MDELTRRLAVLVGAWEDAPLPARVMLTPYVPPLLELLREIIYRLEGKQ